MTDADPVAVDKIDNFKEKLKNLRIEVDGLESPIIDPADIDVEEGNHLDPRVIACINRQTIHRDLNWDIEQATHVIAYYPDPKIDISKGVTDECTRAIETGIAKLMSEATFLA